MSLDRKVYFSTSIRVGTLMTAILRKTADNLACRLPPRKILEATAFSIRGSQTQSDLLTKTIAIMKTLLFALVALLVVAAANAELCKRTKQKFLRLNKRKCKADDDCPQMECIEGQPCLQFACYKKKCVPKDSLPQKPVQCGPNICGDGEWCCNASCGTCVKLGQGCTKQFCQSKEPKTKKLPKESLALDVECKSVRDCPAIKNCIKAPCPSFMCKDYQCVLEEEEEVCQRDRDCPNRDDKCMEGQCVRVAILLPPDVMECEDRYDCPQVRCMAGAPCPTYECQKGQCLAEYHTFPAPTPVKEEVRCNGNLDCPQLRCMAGPQCPTYTCIDHQCVAEYLEIEPIFPPDSMQCKEDFHCPQATCLVGTPCPFYVCKNGQCEAKYHDTPKPAPAPVSCGPSVCKGGDVCNRSSYESARCTPAGGFCTQQACDFSYEKCNVDFDCANEEDVCIEGKCSTPIKPLPGCHNDFECPHPLCAPGTPCPTYLCKGGECVAEPEDEYLKFNPNDPDLKFLPNEDFVGCKLMAIVLPSPARRSLARALFALTTNAQSVATPTRSPAQPMTPANRSASPFQMISYTRRTTLAVDPAAV